jgi:alkylated DNA nucleotide flippase Atl1
MPSPCALSVRKRETLQRYTQLRTTGRQEATQVVAIIHAWAQGSNFTRVVNKQANSSCQQEDEEEEEEEEEGLQHSGESRGEGRGKGSKEVLKPYLGRGNGILRIFG